MSYIYDETTKFKFDREVDVGDISKLVGCKMFTRKLLKLKLPQKFLPTAKELNGQFGYLQIKQK